MSKGLPPNPNILGQLRPQGYGGPYDPTIQSTVTNLSHVSNNMPKLVNTSTASQSTSTASQSTGSTGSTLLTDYNIRSQGSQGSPTPGGYYNRKRHSHKNRRTKRRHNKKRPTKRRR